MSFLAPLFLLGAAALALPLVFHLVRRTTRERTLFGSLMFLRPAPPRLTRRNRLEHLLLLFLRCAVIVLLAAGFARPFLKSASPGEAALGAPRRVVVLVDASASMRRGDLWSRGQDKALAALRAAGPGDQAALFTFDLDLKPLVSFEEWKSAPPGDRVALARQRLAAAAAGWGSSRLDQALVRAAEMLAESDKDPASGPRQAIVITDLQAGSRLSALQGFDWPKGVELIVERLDSPPGANAGLHWIADREAGAAAHPAPFRVRVSNEPDSRREQFQVAWARRDGAPASNLVDVYVPPGQSRVVVLPAPPASADFDRLTLRGDDEPFDNTVFVATAEPARVKVLYLGGESDADVRQPLYFLRRAFQEDRRHAVRVTALTPSAALPASDLEGAALVVVTASLPEQSAAAIRERVQRGRTLLFAPSVAGAGATLSALLGGNPVSLAEAAPSGYAMLAEIDLRHPLFAPFADPRFSDFTAIHFWRYRRLDAAALADFRVLARFDNGDAAIAEAPVGRGRVLVFASGWHPPDSQLALSSKFVPLLYSLLETSGAGFAGPAQHLVGDALPLPAPLTRTNLVVVGPEGARWLLAAGTTNTPPAMAPGIFRLDGGAVAWRCAVNLDPAESRTAPLPIEDLERLGVPVSRSAAPAPPASQRRTHLRNIELEGRQKLWRWFVVAALAVLLTETWLAGRAARRLAAPGGTGV